MGALGGGETQAAEGKGRAEHAARSPPRQLQGLEERRMRPDAPVCRQRNQQGNSLSGLCWPPAPGRKGTVSRPARLAPDPANLVPSLPPSRGFY